MVVLEFQLAGTGVLLMWYWHVTYVVLACYLYDMVICLSERFVTFNIRRPFDFTVMFLIVVHQIRAVLIEQIRQW